MSKPTINLSELPDTELLGSDLKGQVLTAGDLRHKISVLGDVSLFFASWYTIDLVFWKPDAREMLTALISKNADDMYEGWSEIASKVITDEAIQKFQALLDETFSDEEATVSWNTVTKVKIDLKLPKKK